MTQTQSWKFKSHFLLIAAHIFHETMYCKRKSQAKTHVLLYTRRFMLSQLYRIYDGPMNLSSGPGVGVKKVSWKPSNSSLLNQTRETIGDGHPTFNRNPYNGYINPYYWVDEFIPYYMEIMGV